MYTVERTHEFLGDVKRAEARGYDMSLLAGVVKDIAKGNKLEARHRDHQLKGRYSDRRECHVKPDWLLIYRIDKRAMVLQLMRTGTHSDLF
jgi:mRNA interferase YafQ